MKPTTIIIGIILFAVAGAILYAWGLSRQKKQPKELMNLLFSKGMARVRQHMKKHDSFTIEEVEALVTGLSARFPFSANKAVVREPKDFSEQLLGYMERTGQVKKEGNIYKKVK